MGPCSHHTAQEGDAFCLLEMNILWCEKCKSIPEQQQRTMWRCWRKPVRKYLSTVKRVLYRHNLKGHSARKKPLLQNRHKKARLRFATAHGDKDCTFLRNVLWSDETKIKLFGHNDHRYVWRKKGEACTIPTVKHGCCQHHGVGCFAAGGTGVLHKIDGIMRQENYHIKFIYIALLTSADISKCCTETQPKTPNSKYCRCRSMVART